MSVVHTKYHKLHYKAPTWSAAYIFSLVTWIFNLVVPIIVVYRSGGLWIKSSSFFEQPHVHFKHSLVVMVDRIHPSPTKIMYSSHPGMKENVFLDNYRIPKISNREFDNDQDGKLDKLELNISLPLHKLEEVNGVSLILFFDYKLTSQIRLAMDTPLILEFKANSAGSALNIFGDLVFNQKQLLRSRQTFRESFIDSFISKHFSMADMIRAIHERPFTTIPSRDTHFSWTTGRDTFSDSFKIHVSLLYPSQVYYYRPGFWQNIKWFSIQVFPIFFLIYLACEKVRQVIFEEKMISTNSVTE